MIHKFKRTVQTLVGNMGYRIVPRERDAMTMRSVLMALPIRTVVDVGANNGSTCAEWLGAWPASQVHAIEALDRYRPNLAALAARSGGRMTVWSYAASDTEEKVIFREHEDHPSSSSMLKGTELSHAMLPFTQREREVQVSAIPLDTLFQRNGVALDNVFLKLDVQGAEGQVLRGCTKVLEQTVAALVEVNLVSLYEGQSTLQEICSIIEPAGLRFAGMLEQFHGPDNTPIYVDVVFLRGQ